MVLNGMRRALLIPAVFITVAAILSCDKIIIVNCDNCVENEPANAELHLKLEPESYNDVTVSVYRGPIDDNILIDSFVTSSTDYTYTVDLNTKYTFAAEYILISGKTVVVINTAWPRVKYEKEQCENNCYYTYDTTVNLKIKYD
jgi:hypothetical protein